MQGGSCRETHARGPRGWVSSTPDDQRRGRTTMAGPCGRQGVGPAQQRSGRPWSLAGCRWARSADNHPLPCKLRTLPSAPRLILISMRCSHCKRGREQAACVRGVGGMGCAASGLGCRRARWLQQAPRKQAQQTACIPGLRAAPRSLPLAARYASARRRRRACATSMTLRRATGCPITKLSNCLASGLAAVFRVSSPTCGWTGRDGEERDLGWLRRGGRRPGGERAGAAGRTKRSKGQQRNQRA